jgi:hypothetical protein
MKLALIALSAAVAVTVGSSAAMAAKKHHGAGPPPDPRVEMAKKGPQSWCSLQSSCNGWDQYFAGIKAHKKYATPPIVIGKV